MVFLLELGAIVTLAFLLSSFLSLALFLLGRHIFANRQLSRRNCRRSRVGLSMSRNVHPATTQLGYRR